MDKASNISTPTIGILGAGVMGSSLSVPMSDNGNEVFIFGTPFDDKTISSMQENDNFHPALNLHLSPNTKPILHKDTSTDMLKSCDILIIGVSSLGIDWACEVLQDAYHQNMHIGIITKGLHANANNSLDILTTYIKNKLNKDIDIVGVAGPCIALELAKRQNTSVVFASRDPKNALFLKQICSTKYYDISISDDVIGIELCAALKNFYSIMISAINSSFYEMKDEKKIFYKNPLAGAFSQAITEMNILVKLWGGKQESVLGLAGVGDLHVTVGGGRNSKLGVFLSAKEKSISDILSNEMKGVTVEGVDTGKTIYKPFRAAIKSNKIKENQVPMTKNLLDLIINDDIFQL